MRQFLMFLGLGLASATAMETAKPVLSIAAAADLVYVITELNAAFQQRHPGVELKVTTGSSGNFFAQIKNGAPFDVYLSADRKYPQELIKVSLAQSSSLTVYAIGHLVLWTTKPEVDLSSGLKGVTSTTIKKLAIANPEHAPYGRAAKEALQHLGLWESVQPKLVCGENIAQTAQFVQTGNAEAGIVALSLVKAPALAKIGRWVEIPLDHFARLEQAAVITAVGEKNALATPYLTFLRSAQARVIFDRYGFLLPPSS